MGQNKKHPFSFSESFTHGLAQSAKFALIKINFPLGCLIVHMSWQSAHWVLKCLECKLKMYAEVKWKRLLLCGARMHSESVFLLDFDMSCIQMEVLARWWYYRKDQRGCQIIGNNLLGTVNMHSQCHGNLANW